MVSIFPTKNGEPRRYERFVSWQSGATGPFLNHIHMDQSRHDAWPDVNDEFKTTLVMDGGPMRQGPVAKWDSAVETWSRFIMIQHDPSPGFIMNDDDS